ncbi:MerR family transcriptional regulator [Dactylosporangium sp. CA-092794]|uniref:MerR family transcriptional regulator n=1 Tax=Dactylosporangium sp. CA-092794 TaxID=3239929 RepID=UPI003D8FFE7A
MSPRNIRAHQARKLLAPPLRRGRTAVYDDSHVRRLEAIKSLQRQGFNLVSIERLLGVSSSDPAREAMATLVQRLNADHPALVTTLNRHGVVVRAEDGTIRTVRNRALRSALELERAGVRATEAVRLLAEVLDRVREIADEMVRETSARVLSLAPDLTRPRAASWEELDREVTVLSQALTVLLAEAFRIAVENHGQGSMLDLITRRVDIDLHLEDTQTIDNG